MGRNQRMYSMVLLCGVLAIAGLAQDQVNQNSLLISEFNHRVTDYAKLHQTIRSEVHGLKPTKSAEQIEVYQGRLARRIREERHGTTGGNIFTPDVAGEFRRLIGMAMRAPGAVRIRESMQHAAPVKINSLRVNSAYPAGIPLQSTPPSLLLNLPKLPPEVEYRVVGTSLVLRDVDANLIVDYIPNAIVP